MSQKLYLKHTGTPQLYDFDPNGSGRYRQGSGANPYQHEFNWYHMQEQRLKEIAPKINPDTGKPYGYKTAAAIRAALEMSTDEYRSRIKAIKPLREEYYISAVNRMRYKEQRSIPAIAEELGISTGKVQGILQGKESVKNKEMKATADMLKEQVAKYKYVDVGEGANRHLGITEETLKGAIEYLRIKDKYSISKLAIDQLGSKQQGQKTSMLVLSGPDTEEGKPLRQYLYNHLNEVHMINDVISDDLGLTYRGMDYRPLPLDSKRIKIEYADENGYQPKDGVIEIRPGVDDLWLGSNRSYAQVRINVDDKYYLKGMAVYNPNLPEGVDVVFNTNKKAGAPMEKVFKPLKRERKLENGDPDPDSPIDWKNPFGASIMSEEKGGQYEYTDKNGVKHLSLINKVNDEGSWSVWQRSFIPQFGSKQSKELIQKQLDWEYEERLAELEDLKKITNPVVKINLLNDFANSCDSNSADLRGHAMVGQTQRVLLPAQSLKTAFTESGEELGETTRIYNECFAPGYKDGDVLCLIRFPHNGPKEILKCVVNNKNKECRDMVKYGGEKDVIMINPRGAVKLSGADFDGDSVTVIPANGINVDKLLREMAGFDAKQEYPYREGIKLMTEGQKGLEMGTVTNLIADMGQMGCTDEELSRAIKYSQVAIDAVKHKLDWERAKRDLKITDLYKTYTGRRQGGATTFITRAKSKRDVPEIAPDVKIDPLSGDLITRPTGHTHKKWLPPNDKGEYESIDEPNTTKMKRGQQVKDAYELLSDPAHPEKCYWQELMYADFANQMKYLARQARLEMVNTKADPPNKESAKTYAKEVASLEAKLDKVKSQIQYEREALRLATYELKAIEAKNGPLEDDEKSKKQSQLLNSARKAIYPKGKREKIEITEREWEAIQANAISATKLKDIIRQADDDVIRSYATPKNPNNRMLSDARIRQMQRMHAANPNITLMELAQMFGLKSDSTVRNYLSLDV